MSHRSHVANSGSRPIEQCSAACAAPGRSAAASPDSASRSAGHGPPHGRGAQRALRQVQGLLAQHLAGRAGVAGGRTPPGATPRPRRSESRHGTPVAVLALGQHRDVGDLAGRGGVVGLGAVHDRHVLVEVERLDQPGLAAVDVDRARVGRAVGGARVDGADDASGRRLDSCTGAPPVERMSARSLARRGRSRTSPRAARAQQAALDQPVDDLAGGRPEERQVGLGQGCLLRPRRTGAGRGRRGWSGRRPSPPRVGRTAPPGGCTR